MTEHIYRFMFVVNKRWHMCKTSCWQKVRRSPNFLIIGEFKLIYSTPIPWKQLCITRQFLILMLEENNMLSAPITIVETKMCHDKNPSVFLLLWMLTSLALQPTCNKWYKILIIFKKNSLIIWAWKFTIKKFRVWELTHRQAHFRKISPPLALVIPTGRLSCMGQV